MNITTCIRAWAYNNAWANHRLLSACSRLSAGELAMARTGFFGSIIHTLNHILTVDWFYVSGLEGHSTGISAFEPEIPCPLIDDLVQEQRQVDRRLVQLCENLDDPGLDRVIALERKDWTQHETVGRTLLHLFEHQIHHRGQVHTMLSGTGVAPPQLDEFFPGHAREQASRKDDFAALGFSEQHIWR